MKISLVLVFVLSFCTMQSQSITDSKTNSKDDLVVTRYRLSSSELKLENKLPSSKIYLKIFHNSSNSVLDEYILHIPKEDEITFFYGKNPETNAQEMYFKLGKDLLKAYKDKETNQIVEIINVLNYNVFPKSDFSVASAYVALEKSVVSISLATAD